MNSSVPTLASIDAEEILVARLAPLPADEVTAPRPRQEGTKHVQATPSTSRKEAFFPEDKLTRPPHPKDEMNLDIPEARQLATSGSMVMRVWIDSSGKVVSMEIDETDLPEEFTSAVTAAFGKMRFDPGEINGRPVGSIMKFEITHNRQTILPP